jgi:hypothetical protein
MNGDTRWARYPIPGTAGHARSYEITGAADSEIVLDRVTGLKWQRAVDDATYTQAEAVAHCDGLALGGYTDWRLPSRIELVTLVDYSVASPAPTIDLAAFPSTPAEWFWTASPVAGSPLNGWRVSFDGGAADGGGDRLSGSDLARCVR